MTPEHQHNETHWTRLDVPWQGDGVRRRAWALPVFDAGELWRCVSHFDKDCERPEGFGRLASRYENSANPLSAVIWRLFPVFGLAMLGLLASTPFALDDALADGNGRVVAAMFVGELALGFAGWTLMAVGGLWERRFLGCVARATRVAERTYGDHSRLIASANIAGRAARYLFKHLQGRRRTWVAPPAVADSALSLAHPLIDIASTLPIPAGRSTSTRISCTTRPVWWSWSATI